MLKSAIFGQYLLTDLLTRSVQAVYTTRLVRPPPPACRGVELLLFRLGSGTLSMNIAGSFRTKESTPMSQRKSKRWIGYAIAVFGLLGFIAAIAIAVTLKLEGAAARATAQGAFLFMALAFWIGTVVVGIAKGYHVLVGIVLGAISPLGLLILTLMPDLAEKRANDDESRKAASQIQRTPELPHA